MDRKPLPAPFAVGATVRYIGKSRSWTEDAFGREVPLQVPEQVVTVDEVRPGRHGTMRPLPGEWEDEDPPLDTTVDGYSIYHVDVPGRAPVGRIIWPVNAGEWEKV